MTESPPSAQAAALELYVTRGCHLCAAARALLVQVAPASAVLEIEIGYDDALVTRYGTRIPVLRRPARAAELDWPFDAAALAAFLAAP